MDLQCRGYIIVSLSTPSVNHSILFTVNLKFDGTPMRLYSQGTLYASSEVVVRVATAFGVGGERAKLSPSLSMPVQNGVRFYYNLGFW